MTTSAPKYLNTSDGELYHKREVLFGIDLARAAAAKADRMILVEGYTDVLALHQAGLRNAVGIMGTSLTEEQVAELERIVARAGAVPRRRPRRPGGDAAGRAARRGRASSSCAWSALPEGTDPAELVEREGAEALRERVEDSAPFVVFHVERILERADTGSAEGRDRALQELARCSARSRPASLRDELMRRIAGRLELTEGRLRDAARGRRLGAGPARPRRRLAPGGGRRGNGHGSGRARRSCARPGPRTERMFLARASRCPSWARGAGRHRPR